MGWCNDCCFDEKVKVDYQDSEGYLEGKLCAWDNIEITKTGPMSNRCLTIKAIQPCLPSFSSSDNTIWITRTVDPVTWCEIYDFINLCCVDIHDELLAIWPECTPDYWQNIIVAEPGSPIRVTKVNCKLEIWIDMPSFVDADKKVSVDWVCDWDYLRNVVEWTNGIIVEQIWCKMRFRVDPTWIWRERPRASRILTTTYETITWSNNEILPVLWLDNTVEYKNGSWMLANANLITITKPWDYFLSFKVMAEVNDCVHAVRFELLSSNNQRDWVCCMKYEWWNDNGTYGPLAWTWRPIRSASYWWLRIMTFVWWMPVKWLNVWDKFWIMYRISNVYNSFTTHTEAAIRIIGNNWTPITPNIQWGPQFGTWMALHYIWPACV